MSQSMLLSQQQIIGNESMDHDGDVLAMEFFGDEFEKSLRPSLADKLQVGFLTSDQFTQTNDTEILDIKQMTDTVRTLVEDMATLKRDLQFSKQVLKAAFEEKLQNKAFDLYSKVNDRLRDLQDIHEERVAVVRRSFKQQLQDALVKMASQYKKYYEAKLAGKLTATDSSSTKRKIANLEAQLDQNQSVIQMLEVQIEKLKAELEAQPEQTEIKIDTSELDSMQDQNNSLQAEISQLNDKIDDLTTSLEFREDKIKQLGLEIMEGKTELEKERETTQRLAHQIEELKKKMDNAKMNALQELDRQKLALERDMASKLADNEAVSASAARERAKIVEEMEAKMERRLLEERKKYELKLALEREEAQKKNRAIEDSKSMEKILEQQRHEIQVLKMRLIKSQKQWEKKFAILRASLHALKDESYIRLQLQKQAATLKYASISYGPEGPSQSPTNQQSPSAQGKAKPYLPSAKPLPTIKKGSKGFTAKRTNTIPSGIGTDPFSADEEEYEEVEDGFVPLPPKPNVGDFMPPIGS
uniref:Trichohyalin-like n=1 Tax=Phallusia mammillata TaxID=59560 RepID=A0A6F9D8E0_9ASCI|nr:trichohyalin-like [Phallusia mammillata]